jgi:hypothetical protein
MITRARPMTTLPVGRPQNSQLWLCASAILVLLLGNRGLRKRAPSSRCRRRGPNEGLL